MENKPDIFALANFGLKLAEKHSELKVAEIFFGMSEYITIEIEENSVKNSEMGTDQGVSIRVINNRGSLGFAITNILEKKSIENMVANAIKMMKAGTDDPDFKHLPSSYKNYPVVKSLYNKHLRNIQIEDTLKYAEDMIKVCNENESAISQSAGFSSDYSKSYIFNSNGLEAHGKDTLCSISSNIIVKDKGSNETSFGWDWQSERDLDNIDAENIAKNALERGKRNLNRIKIKSMIAPLILTPNATINLILKPIASAINAEAFQYKRSFLVDKRGEMIGSELLTIEDNALIDGAAGSSPFDGEGVPCTNKCIIENGNFLKNGLLHNSYTAGKDDIESTGNAIRKSYTSVPSIGATNFLMKSGDYVKNEIFEGVKEGILLDYTGDSPNIATGDFSGLILQGNLIKNGEIKEPLNETMFGFNLLDLFKKIDAVSKDIHVYGMYRAPYVRIKDINIIGALP